MKPLFCGLCLKSKAAKGGRYWWKLGAVCGECNAFLGETLSPVPQAAIRASDVPVTHCPARGLAAGFDPRFSLPPGAQVIGDFTRDWLAKRHA